MVEPLTAPVTPRSSTPQVTAARTASRVPLPELSIAPIPARWRYAINRVDASGRLTDKSTLRLLGWEPGERCTMTPQSNRAMVIRRDPDGLIELPDRARIRIPASLRKRCGIRNGDRVLLAASEPDDVLVIYTMATLERLLLTAHETLLAGGRP